MLLTPCDVNIWDGELALTSNALPVQIMERNCLRLPLELRQQDQNISSSCGSLEWMFTLDRTSEKKRYITPRRKGRKWRQLFLHHTGVTQSALCFAETSLLHWCRAVDNKKCFPFFPVPAADCQRHTLPNINHGTQSVSQVLRGERPSATAKQTPRQLIRKFSVQRSSILIKRCPLPAKNRHPVIVGVCFGVSPGREAGGCL